MFKPVLCRRARQEEDKEVGATVTIGGRSQDHDFLSLGIGGVSHPQQHPSRRCTKLEPETNIKTYFDMKVGVSVWQLPLPDQDIKLMIKSNDAIMACSGSSHKIAKPISNHNIYYQSSCLHSIPLQRSKFIIQNEDHLSCMHVSLSPQLGRSKHPRITSLDP